MKVGLFLGMCHIFLISRGLQKNSLLICISKIHYFVRKNSQNAGVNRAEKSISVHSLYTNEVTDYLKSAGIYLASIHQLLKNNANPCVCSIALMSKIICMILGIDKDLLLTVQTSFVYLLNGD